VRARSGTGLTDHPTTDSVKGYVTNLGDVPIPKDSSAKIIFYSRGRRNANNEILYPFNVEMNVNHEYWHLRENDANAPQQPVVHTPGSSVIDIKFSFGNCLDEANQVLPAAPFEYVPEIAFRNQKWLDHLAGSRFPALAGWHKSYDEIFATLNDITYRIFRRFSNFGSEPRPLDDENKEVWYGQGKGFGMGTVHHAVGTLRMPYCPSYTEAPHFDSVVDEDLRVIGTANLYVCDMSVLPFASAANPVRTLAALALRLSDHFG
jgi:hypothetical protein